ncbi:NACHT and WD40 repeat domain-containing protein [Phormidium sp. CCY1219]|uniref:NACHT and WD40 repeat domain-containing protein n=1 Tax=Phormidium sp. CCY1219 TaxID=2886104 RepID=UPI002D1EA3F8|nr:NACHT domain-containing protein [Phormidium sp. CCY1219]MEB3830664.1 NACHT domain-containing protein [Phormidium sp. CCY1219]
MVGTDEIIRAILAIARTATPVIINTAQRNELVIKLLKRFQFDPDHPPADFTGVYRYTLVEYGLEKLEHVGVEKLRLILELFRQIEIQQAFRNAFDRNDPSRLLQEAEDYIYSYALGDKIREQGIEHQRELAKFSAIFMDITNRTRTPAEVLQFRKIEDLNQRTSQILDQLNNLNALEDIRQDLAKLTQSDPNPLLANPDPAEKRLPSAFAHQVRDWLESLYDFETYQVITEKYFEWIINIRARRGFDRILVRGIEGEVTIRDVYDLGQVVDRQKVDEGWLVAPRRISQAAVDAVENDPQLFCYTLDELIDESADFSGYFQWLEAEVKKRHIEELYVPLACTKEELDPISKKRLAKSRYDGRNGWIDRYINRWLDDPAKEHISILGEFGTGKTWFALHYAWQTLQKYRVAKEEGSIRPRLPLVIPLRDYAKAVSVESLFSEFFFRKHEIGLPGYSAFDRLNRMGKLLLIFDGFDEMAAKVDRQEMINNFWQLAKVVVPGSKVILTCRTEHFPEAREGRDLLNAELKASTSNLTGETPQFEVLELEKFQSERVGEVLGKRASPEIVEKVMSHPQLVDLARRPVMIELILEALPEIESGKPIDLARIYWYAVRRKMERDIKTERTFTSMADKLFFLCELSWEMLAGDRMSLNYREFPDRIRQLFGPVVQQQKDLDHWHYDMMGQTMLIRNADGDYAPAHRSLLEFFVAYKLAAQLGVLAPDFAELGDIQNYPFSQPLRETFGRSPLTKAVLDLLLPAIAPGSATEARLLQLVEGTKGQTETEVGYLGANAIALLLQLNPNALDDRDLRQTVVVGGDFSHASLRNTNFAEATVSQCIFANLFGMVLSVAFTPDGQYCATGDQPGDIYLWQVADGKPIWRYSGHAGAVWSLAVAPDGNTLVSASDDTTVKLWQVQSGNCIKTLTGHTSRVLCARISPDGKTLATGSADRTVKLWDLQTGECLHTLYGHASVVWSVAISPDGKTLVSGSGDQTVKLWDIPTGDCLKTLQGHIDWVLSVGVTPDGKTVVSASADETVKLWDIQSGTCSQTLAEHSSSVWSVDVARDGKTLASGGADRAVKLWDLETGECLQTWTGHSNRVGSVAIAPDGQTLASASADETVKLWHIRTGECLRTIHGYASAVTAVAIAPDGEYLASGSADRLVKLWNVRTGQCAKTFAGHHSKVMAVAIAPGEETLVSLCAEGTVKRWHRTTGQCIATRSGYASAVGAVAIAPDGNTLASGGADRAVKLWNIDTGVCVANFPGHTSKVISVGVAWDSKRVVSGTDDGTINVWEVASGQCVKTIQRCESVVAIAIGPDGNTLASGTEEGRIYLWDIQRGESVASWQAHPSAVLSLAFHPQGNRLVSGSEDEWMKLWEVPSGDCVQAIVNQPYAGMNITGAIGLTEAQKSTLKALGAVEHEAED